MTQLLFVDDVRLFGDGSYDKWMDFKRILNSFYFVMGMDISETKLIILGNALSNEVEEYNNFLLSNLNLLMLVLHIFVTFSSTPIIV